MRKRILASIMALLLAVSLMPLRAMAAPAEAAETSDAVQTAKVNSSYDLDGGESSVDLTITRPSGYDSYKWIQLSSFSEGDVVKPVAVTYKWNDGKKDQTESDD